jgi:hypothetical protein
MKLDFEETPVTDYPIPGKMFEGLVHYSENLISTIFNPVSTDKKDFNAWLTKDVKALFSTLEYQSKDVLEVLLTRSVSNMYMLMLAKAETTDISNKILYRPKSMDMYNMLLGCYNSHRSNISYSDMIIFAPIGLMFLDHKNIVVKFTAEEIDKSLKYLDILETGRTKDNYLTPEMTQRIKYSQIFSRKKYVSFVHRALAFCFIKMQMDEGFSNFQAYASTDTVINRLNLRINHALF